MKDLKLKLLAGCKRWTKMMEVNLNAVIRGTQLAIQIFKKQGKGGVIVNTASLAGIYPQTAPTNTVYGVAKAGVVHFSRSLANLYESDKIRVVAICPGFTESPMTEPIKGIIQDFFKETIMKADTVIEGFIQLITDKDKRGGGAVMRITSKTGIDYPSILNRRSKL
eukprot:TRINITY_DN10227_c0_g1_i2.p1 TRINITY_DN10227_c0_g1~~TRINITY_DN10227_c0_g1_i2.p1  ORF type:complete len:166 (+),score=39.97 TRINITY_DN10227_c0_g1_i2:237-734(+)